MLKNLIVAAVSASKLFSVDYYRTNIEPVTGFKQFKDTMYEWELAATK
jgi:hypothetical protein